MRVSERVNFAAVKQAANLKMVLQWYRTQGLRPSSADQLRGMCPIHGNGGTDAFHASLGKNAFRCFYCQAQGNVLDFVAAMEKCSVREAALLLQKRLGIDSHATRSATGATPPGQIQLVPKKEGFNPPLSFTLPGIDCSHLYLRHRGIRAETARYFGVGFFGGIGLMRGRVVIPLHDESGRLVAYCGRSLDGTSPRYKLPSGLAKSRLLFNLHRVVHGATEVVLVEGFFDCMKIHQAGFPSVVALMGTTFSQHQQQMILRRFQRVVVLLDGDAAGRDGSAAIAERLKTKCNLTILHLPDRQQPDQLSTTEIRHFLNPTGFRPQFSAE